jgi:hypothetical protein
MKTFAHGLGVGTHTRLTYQFPTKVYDRFTCLLGLHATLGAEGHVIFRIYANGIAVYDSSGLTGEDTARQIDLPLEGVREISIDVDGAPPVKAGSNYAVIAEPVLHKAKGRATAGYEKIP